MNIFEPQGTLHIDLIKNSFVPGEMVKGTVKLVLRKPVNARGFIVSFIGEEWVDVGCGSGKTRREKKEEIKVHSEVIQLSSEGLIDFIDRSFEFKIPEDAPPTIKGDEAGLRWLVHAKLDVPMGRDKNEKVEVFVY